MLIRFSVKNFRSFKEENTFSLEMVGSQKLSDTNAFHCEGLAAKEKLLKSAIIYGANASGKSNLLRALSVMQDVICSGGIAEESIRSLLEPFRFTETPFADPISFEIEFIHNRRHYRYGFSCDSSADSSAIESEWLWVKKQRMTLLFAREKNAFVEKSPTFEELNAWEKAIASTKLSLPGESLFLATAARLFNGGCCSEVIHWFKNELIIVNANSHERFMMGTFERLKRNESPSHFAQFLQKADFGIHNFKPHILEVQDGKDRKTVVQVTTEHIVNGKSYFLNLLYHESDGTKKIFALAGIFLDALKNGTTLVLDELDAQLHPLLIKHLIELFHENNMTGAQLIATAHSPAILTENDFRRDQIWFVDKMQDGGSRLISLADFTHIRGNYHRIVQDYLRGCFGGVPYIQDLKVD